MLSDEHLGFSLIRTKLVLADVDVASASGSTSGIGVSLLAVAANAGMYASRFRQAAQPPARCVSQCPQMVQASRW